MLQYVKSKAFIFKLVKIIDRPSVRVGHLEVVNSVSIRGNAKDLSFVPKWNRPAVASKEGMVVDRIHTK